MMNPSEQLEELASLAQDLLNSENEARFGLGEVLVAGRALCTRGGKVQSKAFAEFRQECGFGDGARTYCLDLMSTFLAFPEPELRRAELSWTAHREAARAATRMDMEAGEILDKYQTVIGIKQAVRGNEFAPQRRVDLPHLIKILIAFGALRDACPDELLLRRTDEAYKILQRVCGSAGYALA